MVPPRNDRFGDFTERLDRAKGRHKVAPDAQARGSAMGTAFRISSELVVGLFVGGYFFMNLFPSFGTPGRLVSAGSIPFSNIAIGIKVAAAILSIFVVLSSTKYIFKE